MKTYFLCSLKWGKKAIQIVLLLIILNACNNRKKKSGSSYSDTSTDLHYETGNTSQKDVKTEATSANKQRTSNKEIKTTEAPPKLLAEEGRPSPDDVAKVNENTFLNVKAAPLSTFSIDVDNASYSITRKTIHQGRLPSPQQIRIEEFINYFQYEYKNAESKHPFSINTEVAPCPWNNKHQLVHIGLKGKQLDNSKLKSSNLVFLIDVSGSMGARDKLPLLKKAFKVLVNNLREEDRVAIVVYAGSAGLVLPSTSGTKKHQIMEALDKLQSGGSTAGGQGIRLAYKIAQENFIKNGNNRIILATDGDFNIGESSDEAMQQLIEEKRKQGVFITVLGLGMGNYRDSKMEIIADKGNGNYYYLDNLNEAYKVFGKELKGTLFTIAKDVKIQIEFNSALVKSYRLIGYENRLLANRDFRDDTKDAGEIGAGHTVTALYEIALYDTPQIVQVNATALPSDFKSSHFANQQLMNVRLRYKKPDGNTGIETSQMIKANQQELDSTSDNFRFSAAVAAFGMLLKNSQYKGSANFESVIKLANAAKGEDKHGYRSELIDLVKKASKIKVQ